MNRRRFIQSTLALGAAGWLPVTWSNSTTSDQAAFNPSPANGWRLFEVTTQLEPAVAEGALQAWVPLPSFYADEWMRPMGNLWQGNANGMSLYTDPVYGTQMLHAQWSNENKEIPMLEVVSRFATRDRAIDWNKPGAIVPLSTTEKALFTQPTQLLPTDGIVHDTAQTITQGKTSDIDKARAIYEWIVLNTVRDPKVEGCGLGDIRWMLETGNLKGKCADLNTLYVGLARAAGLPARDVYGLRVADSRFGYKSLGKSGDVSKGQHCRAEVFLNDYGWVAVDPADVRKVILEENKDQQLSLDDPKVQAVRDKLFGGWEGNWMAYNTAHDLNLPSSQGKSIAFMMYPQAETATGERLNAHKPDQFRYQLTSRELNT